MEAVAVLGTCIPGPNRNGGAAATTLIHRVVIRAPATVAFRTTPEQTPPPSAHDAAAIDTPMSPDDALAQALAKALAQGGDNVTAVVGNSEPITLRQACATGVRATATGQSERLGKSRSLELKTGRGDGPARSPDDIHSANGVVLEQCLETATPA